MRLRNLIIGAAATGLAFTTLAVAGGSPAWARARTGTGTYSCSHETGSVQFSPAWTDTGTGKVKATVDILISACSGGTPLVSSAQLTGHFKFANGGSTWQLRNTRQHSRRAAPPLARNGASRAS